MRTACQTYGYRRVNGVGPCNVPRNDGEAPGRPRATNLHAKWGVEFVIPRGVRQARNCP